MGLTFSRVWERMVRMIVILLIMKAMNDFAAFIGV
jgi:hypothetical protein